LIDELQSFTDRLEAALEEHPDGDSLAHRERHARDVIIPP